MMNQINNTEKTAATEKIAAVNEATASASVLTEQEAKELFRSVATEGSVEAYKKVLKEYQDQVERYKMIDQIIGDEDTEKPIAYSWSVTTPTRDEYVRGEAKKLGKQIGDEVRTALGAITIRALSGGGGLLNMATWGRRKHPTAAAVGGTAAYFSGVAIAKIAAKRISTLDTEIELGTIRAAAGYVTGKHSFSRKTEAMKVMSKNK